MRILQRPYNSPVVESLHPCDSDGSTIISWALFWFLYYVSEWVIRGVMLVVVVIRSFALNFEVNLLLYGAQVTERLRAEQRRYIADSVRLTRAQWRKRPAVQKLLEKLAKLLSPLL